MKLLIADDKEENRYFLEALLTGHGHDVLSAAHGAEALEMARTDPPDMIVTDILMPVMDGFALCRKWRQDPRLRNIPFVFYTATYTDPRDEEFALSLGADRFLVKPAEPDAFMKMLDEVIQASGKDRFAGLHDPPEAEEGHLKKYNEALIRKLEDKMQQLEEANQLLEREVAEHRQAERSLRETKQFTDTALDAQLDTFFLFDPQAGRALRWNQAFTRLSGYSDAEISELPAPASYYSPEDLERAADFVAETFRGGSGTIELALICKDGREIPFEYKVAAVNDAHGEPRYLISIGRDITESRRVEQALRESERRLATLMANLPGMAYRCRNEPDWPMEFVSDGCLLLTGYEAHELTADGSPSYGDLIVDEDRQLVWDAVQQGVQSGKPFAVEYRVLSRDGTVKWVWEQGQGVNVSGGRTVKLEGFITDVTERKRAERELLATQAQLSQAEKFAAIGRVSSGIAHEINNPLASVASSAELLEEHLDVITDLALREAIEKHAGRIRHDVQRCTDIIQNIRGFAQGKAGETVEVNVADVLTQSVETFIAGHPTGNRAFRCVQGAFGLEDVSRQLGVPFDPGHVPDSEAACRVAAVPGHLDRIVTNLIRNAVESTDEDAAIILVCELRGEAVTMAIADNGPGIADSALSYIFEPFYTTKEAGGTGLGLYITRRLVESMGGKITCESREGIGSVFRVWLPTVASAEGRHE
jgi:PAS domain S-box-containing protein